MYSEYAKYINVDDALGRLGGNQTLYKSLLTRFAENNYMDKLRADVEAQDVAEAEKTAHLIKGVTSNLSLIAVADEAAEMVSLLRAGAEYLDCYNRLVEDMETTMGCIRKLMEEI